MLKRYISRRSKKFISGLAFIMPAFSDFSAVIKYTVTDE